jgi:hypothetical protein
MRLENTQQLRATIAHAPWRRQRSPALAPTKYFSPGNARPRRKRVDKNQNGSTIVRSPTIMGSGRQGAAFSGAIVGGIN